MKQKKASWEKEFDENIGAIILLRKHLTEKGEKYFIKKNKDFIRQEKQETAREMGEVLKMEKRPKPEREKFRISENYMRELWHIFGHNSVVKQLNQKIDNYLKKNHETKKS